MSAPLRITPDDLVRRGADLLPGHLGIEILDAGPDAVCGRIALAPHHRAPNGYLHGGTVVALADTLCGYGTVLSLPEGGTGFTTAELKTNFLGTAREGAIVGQAWPVHRGRTTQVWDATVSAEGGERPIALFRCTQLVLRARG